MAAATVSISAPGTNLRATATPMTVPAFVPITIAASSTAYATATGGLPFDLAAFVNSLGQLSAPANYKDIVGFIGTSTTGYVAAQFAVGTATYASGTSGALATLPCTVRLWTSGASELADANISQTINGFLMINRSGTN